MLLPDKKDSMHKAWLYRLLRKIADDNFLVLVLRFKGGTCAAIRGFLDRFSVDLDFDIVGEEVQIPEIRKRFERIFLDLGLEIKDQSDIIPQYFLKYPKNEFGRNNLKIDSFFPALAGNKYEAVRLIDIDRIVYCQTIETMFANKLVAIIDRFKKRGAIAARDIYDIHHFFEYGYDYDINIIELHSNKIILEYMEDLHKFITGKISQKIIDQDLNFLLTPEKFKRIRKNLKQESLMFLKDEISRLENLKS